MVLCQGLPHCLCVCVDPCMANPAQSQLKSTCLTAKFGRFLDHAEMGKKGQNVISSSIQHPISFSFAIHVSFIILLPMMWISLAKPMQKSVTTVCLHCSFATLKNKHIGVLGTNVATTFNKMATLVPSTWYRVNRGKNARFSSFCQISQKYLEKLGNECVILCNTCLLYYVQI